MQCTGNVPHADRDTETQRRRRQRGRHKDGDRGSRTCPAAFMYVRLMDAIRESALAGMPTTPTTTSLAVTSS